MVSELDSLMAVRFFVSEITTKRMIRLLTVIGARPQIIKSAAISR